MNTNCFDNDTATSLSHLYKTLNVMNCVLCFSVELSTLFSNCFDNQACPGDAFQACSSEVKLPLSQIYDWVAFSQIYNSVAFSQVYNSVAMSLKSMALKLKRR